MNSLEIKNLTHSKRQLWNGLSQRASYHDHKVSIGNSDNIYLDIYDNYSYKLSQWSDICEKNIGHDRRAKKRPQGKYALDNTHTNLMIDKWVRRAIGQVKYNR